ncbi:hypothetical protein HU200_029959 [Digitaria exilis]|uniref:Uncharacterized protein n=1 Tax=Digitaria exilis TaxID=1010633 RepID=A0A835BP80_9POAL|nr:hypothetical protein HU200_029959 [Digitaria exilis]
MPPIGDPDASLHRVAFEIGYISCILGRYLCGSNYSSLKRNGHTYLELGLFLAGVYCLSTNAIFAALDMFDPSNSRP